MVTVTATGHGLSVQGKHQPMHKTVPQVRTVALSEYKLVARTLAEAFWEDHVGRYFFDTPNRAGWSEEKKWNLHLSIFEYLTYAHILNGRATTIGDDYGCVALWLPPKTHIDSLWTMIRSGMWRLYYKLCAEGRYRMFTEFFPLLNCTKAAVMGSRDEDSYYLVYLGTRIPARGKGFARAIIAEMTEQADKDGKAAYLESSNPVNLGFYERMGFKTCKSIDLVRGSEVIPLDCMLREPEELNKMLLRDGEANRRAAEKGSVGIASITQLPNAEEEEHAVALESVKTGAVVGH